MKKFPYSDTNKKIYTTIKIQKYTHKHKHKLTHKQTNKNSLTYKPNTYTLTNINQERKLSETKANEHKVTI